MLLQRDIPIFIFLFTRSLLSEGRLGCFVAHVKYPSAVAVFAIMDTIEFSLCLARCLYIYTYALYRVYIQCSHNTYFLRKNCAVLISTFGKHASRQASRAARAMIPSAEKTNTTCRNYMSSELRLVHCARTCESACRSSVGMFLRHRVLGDTLRAREGGAPVGCVVPNSAHRRDNALAGKGRGRDRAVLVWSSLRQGRSRRVCICEKLRSRVPIKNLLV
jgi:hypothetical protein